MTKGDLYWDKFFERLVEVVNPSRLDGEVSVRNTACKFCGFKSCRFSDRTRSSKLRPILVRP